MAKRFFSDDSFWNTPLGRDVEADPESGRFIELLKADEYGNHFAIALRRWTIPVYEVDSSVPRRRVHRRAHDENKLRELNSKWAGCGNRFGHGPGFDELGVPIPDYAAPDPQVDAHLAAVDWESRRAWDMWAARKRPDGEWESNTGVTYRLDGPGVFERKDYQAKKGESIHFYGPSRASGVPALAGLIMRDEVEAGCIEHKLAFACRSTAFQEFVSPAIWTDGWLKGGLPEGCIIQLDPALEPGGFGLKPGALAVARALQEYGAVLVDHSGGNTLYGEGLWAKPGLSWDGLLDTFDLKAVGMERFRILKLGEIVPLGDRRDHHLPQF